MLETNVKSKEWLKRRGARALTLLGAALVLTFTMTKHTGVSIITYIPLIGGLAWEAFFPEHFEVLRIRSCEPGPQRAKDMFRNAAVIAGAFLRLVAVLKLVEYSSVEAVVSPAAVFLFSAITAALVENLKFTGTVP
jgi:hypothetical protein